MIRELNMTSDYVHASNLFKIGDRVKLSRFGENRLIVHSTGHKIGTVVGFGQYPHRLRVKRDGLKNPITYHFAFWERYN